VKRTLSVGRVAAATAADAHHSFAKTYAEDKHISLEGEVVSFEYRNPHAWVYFNAADSTGVVRKFGAEWSNPRRLEQQGVLATTLKAGDHIVVSGADRRRPSTRCTSRASASLRRLALARRGTAGSLTAGCRYPPAAEARPTRRPASWPRLS
jgi:hypothetical protein